MRSSLLRTVGIALAFLVTCGLIGSGAFWWAESMDPLAGLDVWVFRAMLYCLSFALVPWSLVVVHAMVWGHVAMRERCAKKLA